MVGAGAQTTFSSPTTLAAAAAGFTIAALWGGAEALLAMLAGFQLARSLVVRREKRVEAETP